MPVKATEWMLDPDTMRMVRYFPHEVVLEMNEVVTAGRLASLLVRYSPDSIVEMGPELITIIERQDRAEFQEEHEVRMISNAIVGESSKDELRKALAEALKNLRVETQMRTLVASLRTNTAEMETMVKGLKLRGRYI